VKLAADANVLLAAVLGGRARLILGSAEIEEILTAETTFADGHGQTGNSEKQKIGRQASLFGPKRRRTLLLRDYCQTVEVGPKRECQHYKQPEEFRLAKGVHYRRSGNVAPPRAWANLGD
jgi:hypothetical protein